MISLLYLSLLFCVFSHPTGFEVDSSHLNGLWAWVFDAGVAAMIVILVDLIRVTIIAVVVVTIKCWCYDTAYTLLQNLVLFHPEDHVSVCLHAHVQHKFTYTHMHNHLNINIKWKLIVFSGTQTAYRTAWLCLDSNIRSNKNHLRNYFTLISESHAFCPAKANYCFIMLAACSLELYRPILLALTPFSSLSIVDSQWLSLSIILSAVSSLNAECEFILIGTVTVSMPSPNSSTSRLFPWIII